MIDALFLLIELFALVLFLSAVRRATAKPKSGHLGMFAFREDQTEEATESVKRKKGKYRA